MECYFRGHELFLTTSLTAQSTTIPVWKRHLIVQGGNLVGLSRCCPLAIGVECKTHHSVSSTAKMTSPARRRRAGEAKWQADTHGWRYDCGELKALPRGLGRSRPRNTVWRRFLRTEPGEPGNLFAPGGSRVHRIRGFEWVANPVFLEPERSLISKYRLSACDYLRASYCSLDSATLSSSQMLPTYDELRHLGVTAKRADVPQPSMSLRST